MFGHKAAESKLASGLCFFGSVENKYLNRNVLSENPTSMRNKKFLRDFFAQDSSNAPALVALLAGMAAGAALGILFAVEDGRQLRNRICNWFRNDNPNRKEDQDRTLQNYRAHLNRKKPKSDIHNLIHQAHHTDVHTEQGFG